MCGKDRCIYYGCDLCSLRLDQAHIDGLPWILQRDECECLNHTYAELCSQRCADTYTSAILDCICGHPNPVTITRGASAK
jgi:hypothetical protein